MVKKILAANWKMNGDQNFAANFFAEFEQFQLADYQQIDTVFCVPGPLLSTVKTQLAQPNFYLGAQDCHAEDKGAFTGDLSASLIKDFAAEYVIIGHSERRAAYAETDQLIAKKHQAAIRNGLTPIICIGESLAQREHEDFLGFLKEQLKASLALDCLQQNFIVAYEPIWAIGTGKVPAVADVAEVFAQLKIALRELAPELDIDQVPLLYGGSVNAGNCKEFSALTDLSGYLVGSASLKAQDFFAIMKSLG